MWNDNYEELQKFVANTLNINGSWKSPGGDAKLFVIQNDNGNLKWHGPKTKKIKISNDSNNKLSKTLENLATKTTKPSSVSDQVKRNTTLVNTIPTSIETSYNDKIESIMSRLCKLEETRVKEARDYALLVEQNNKMECEIKELKDTVVALQEENECIVSLLDSKQANWIHPRTNNPKPKPPAKAKSYALAVSNGFTPLRDENQDIQEKDISSLEGSDETRDHDSLLDSDTSKSVTTRDTTKSTYNQAHISSSNNKRPPASHPSRQNPKTQSSEKNVQHNSNPTPRRTINRQPGLTRTEPQILILADSMTKNIDNKKLSYAAKKKTCCKTNRGAKISDIRKNLEEECGESDKFHSIVLHVGTNNLSCDDAKVAAEEMDRLIEDARKKTANVAVSGVVKRYDNRVPNSDIIEFNNLVKNLCVKHNATFIDNEEIDDSMLNGSKLHLNHKGDKALGKNFCAYFKSIRPKHNVNESNAQFFRPNRRQPDRPKDWEACLTHLANLIETMRT